MARALLRFNKPDTAFWVQDYHFLALGAELRELGVTGPIGFFLHTPWPAHSVIEGVPHHRELIEAMLAYDLIGFQTEDDRDNFLGYVRTNLELPVHDDVVISQHGRTRAAVFPIGIDAEKFAQQAAKSVTHPDVSRLRRSLNGERLAIGVDRLDYSKGLVNRISAFDRMWTEHPHLARTVSLLQIATLSRGGIEAYGQLQSDVAKLVSDVNGRHGEVDWTPIRYLNKGFGQAVLAGLYRTAQVGVVTPLHDGMNLVAKEYVAAQNPADPGVLVLSKFAGAANELDTALLVNPHDIDGMARTIATALSMPLTERRMRYEAMMGKLRSHSIQQWFADFIEALQESQIDKAATATARGQAALRGRCDRRYGPAARIPLIDISSNRARHRASGSAFARLGFSIGTDALAAAADDDALADDDRRFVADDDARVRRGETRFRPVGPDDRVARKDAAPPVVARDVVALPGAALGARRAGKSEHDHGDGRDRRRHSLLDAHVVPLLAQPAAQISRRTWAVLGSPGGASRGRRRSGEPFKCRYKSINYTKFAVCSRLPLAKTLMPRQERASGEMAEWLKAHAWKACVRETVPWVRIPLSPP